MRNFLFIIVLLGFCSCKQKVKVSDSTDTTTVLLPVQKPQTTNDREKIIVELNKFSDAIAKKDRSAILSFFNFPLADSTVNFFEVDSVFDAKRKLSNGAITKEMFSNSFETIYERTEMNEFNTLFNHINTNDLAKKSHIDYTKKAKDDGCIYLYGITIKGNDVYLNYGTNSNDDYRETHPDEEEVCGEYGVSWEFKFDGEKLKFFKHRIAG